MIETWKSCVKICTASWLMRSLAVHRGKYQWPATWRGGRYGMKDSLIHTFHSGNARMLPFMSWQGSQNSGYSSRLACAEYNCKSHDVARLTSGVDPFVLCQKGDPFGCPVLCGQQLHLLHRASIPFQYKNTLRKWPMPLSLHSEAMLTLIMRKKVQVVCIH